MARRVTVKNGMALMARRTFGTIRQLPSGRWHARFRDRDGQQKSAPQTFTTPGIVYVIDKNPPR